MANIKEGHPPSTLDVKLTCANGGIVLPCMDGCDKTPWICGSQGGLIYSSDQKGAYCSSKMERIAIVSEA